jgi:hypothetical protein
MMNKTDQEIELLEALRDKYKAASEAASNRRAERVERYGRIARQLLGRCRIEFVPKIAGILPERESWGDISFNSTNGFLIRIKLGLTESQEGFVLIHEIVHGLTDKVGTAEQQEENDLRLAAYTSPEVQQLIGNFNVRGLVEATYEEKERKIDGAARLIHGLLFPEDSHQLG